MRPRLIASLGGCLNRHLTSPDQPATCPAGPIATSLEQFAQRAADEANQIQLTALEVGHERGRYGHHFEPDRYHSVQVDATGPIPGPARGHRLRPGFHALPLDDERFGLVLCTEVVERTVEPPALLAELNRVLEPGRRLFLSAPLIVGERRNGQRPRRPRYGLNYLLEASGFRIEDLQRMQAAQAYAIVARKTRRPG